MYTGVRAQLTGPSNSLLALESQDSCLSQESQVDIILLEYLLNQSLVFILVGIFPIKKGLLGVSILVVKYLKAWTPPSHITRAPPHAFQCSSLIYTSSLPHHFTSLPTLPILNVSLFHLSSQQKAGLCLWPRSVKLISSNFWTIQRSQNSNKKFCQKTRDIFWQPPPLSPQVPLCSYLRKLVARAKEGGGGCKCEYSVNGSPDIHPLPNCPLPTNWGRLPTFS